MTAKQRNLLRKQIDARVRERLAERGERRIASPGASLTSRSRRTAGDQVRDVPLHGRDPYSLRGQERRLRRFAEVSGPGLNVAKSTDVKIRRRRAGLSGGAAQHRDDRDRASPSDALAA